MRKLFVGVIAAGILAGCGLKGPLYLPSSKPATKPPQSTAPAQPAKPDDTKPAQPDDTKPAPASR